MSLTGKDSLKSLLHDLVESLQHKLDKLALGQRKLYDFLIVPKDRSLEFTNRFPVLEDSGIYLLASPVAAVAFSGKPEEWDKDGTIASFSAGSEVAALRNFLQSATDEKGEKRKRRGKAKADGTKEALPPPPPNNPEKKFEAVRLEEVESEKYLASMLGARARSANYHRWTSGEGGRMYWKGCPVTTRTVEADDVSVDEFLGPLAKAFKFSESDDEAGLRKLVEAQKGEAEVLFKNEKAAKKAVNGTSDLRRYTINAHPALARAMALLLENGVAKEIVSNLMVGMAPLVVAEFERITGRKAVGVSIHFDSSLPHWNIWHTGLESVLYQVGKSERTRYRRTAMDLNASGNMLAWDRASRAFSKVGEDFAKISPATAEELEKAEKRAIERQNRPPGDFTLNRKADEVVEVALVEMGFAELVDRGYREYVENEKKRYAAAIAGRDPKDIKKMIDLLDLRRGETPLAATRRVVAERERIKKNFVDTKGGEGAELGAARDDDQKLRETLRPDGDETLVDAARRVVATSDALQVDLAATEKKVESLETEIGPLRKLKEAVVSFLKAVMKTPVKVGDSLIKMLKEIGALAEEKFEPRKKDDPGMPM